MAALAAFIVAAPSYFLFGQYADDSRNARMRQVIYSHFTASSTAVVFPVTFDDKIGLLFFDRANGDKRLIYGDEFNVSSPQWSPDGERLLFVRWWKGSASHELMS